MSIPMHRTPARMTPDDLQAPTLKWRDAVTRLRHFAIITWAVDPEVLAAQLPKGITPDTVQLDDGSLVALVSAVPFEDVDFHFRGAPFYKVSMGQTNYRAYVIHEGKRVVWFFGTTLTGGWIRVPRDRWKLPWYTAKMRFDVQWGGDGQCERYALQTESPWAPMTLEMQGSEQGVGRLDGFADEEDTLTTLTHPLLGYYWRRDEVVGSYSVWHEPLRLARTRVTHVRAHLYERLGLITPETPVHSALVQPEVTFHVHLPPTRVEGLQART